MGDSTIKLNPNIKQQLKEESQRLGISTLELINIYVEEEKIENQPTLENNASKKGFKRSQEVGGLRKYTGMIKVGKKVDSVSEVLKMRHGEW